MLTFFNKRKSDLPTIEKNPKRHKVSTNKTSKTQQRFYINKPEDRETLARDAGFKYIDQYEATSAKFNNAFNTKKFKNFAQRFENVDIYIAPVARLHGGKGAYAAKSFTFNGTPIPLGVYWGEAMNEPSQDTSYLFGTGSTFVDAKLKGNWTRFVNHSQNGYNVIAESKSIKINNVRIPYILYSLCKSVQAGDELLFDYGDQYQFTHDKQIFLNPSDNEDQPQEILLKHKHEYDENITTFGKMDTPLLKPLGFTADFFYTPKLVKMVLDDPENLNQYLKNHKLVLDLPLLFVDKKAHLLPIDQQPGITALMLAAYAGNTKAVKVLIEHGASIEQQHAAQGQTALFYAIRSKASSKEVMIAYLLKQGAKLTTQDEEGMTPLHWCVKQNDLATLSLIFKNPDKDSILALDRVTAKEELCPITMAIKFNNKEIFSFLIAQYNKSHPKKFFDLTDTWFYAALPKAIQSNPDFDATMFELLMSNGLKNNLSGLIKILPLLEEKGILIEASPKKTTVDLTFHFPDGTLQTYNMKQHIYLKRFLKTSSPTGGEEANDHSRKRKREPRRDSINEMSLFKNHARDSQAKQQKQQENAVQRRGRKV